MSLAEAPTPRVRKQHTFLAYHSQLHDRLRSFANAESTNADLIESLPAAAVAIAGDGYPMELRRAGMHAVRAGASLRDVANALKLPSWTRKLPPQALGARLPAALSSMNETGLGVRLANAMPRRFYEHSWLDHVALAYACAHGDYAVWVARALANHTLSEAQIVVLGAYAWCSTEGLALMHPPPARLWRSQMTPINAAGIARRWIMHVSLSLVTSSQPRERRAPYTFGRFMFEALTTQSDLVTEGRLMSHCVADYTLQVALGSSRIYSIRRDGERVATMEIRVDGDRPDEIALAQIKGPLNVKPDAEVIAAAYAYTERLRFEAPPPFPAKAWREIWRPYWDAKGRRAPLDMSPAHAPRLLMAELLDLTE